MKLIAKRRGFYKNRLVERGATFDFDTEVTKTDADGKTTVFKPKIPKWAGPVGATKVDKDHVAGDTKPADARAAVEAKAKGEPVKRSGTASME